MTLTNNLALNPAVPPDSPELLALPQRQKVVLVIDLVESVRLMAANELAVVDHWRGFVRHATTHVLPQHEGRMVKSLGDGLMVEFESPRNATNAAMQLHRYFDTANATLPPDQQLYLRAGLNTAQVYIDDIDIYGSGVNLAARVASLAGPGETMVTAEVRDGLTDGLDAKVEDMGECYLKHVALPVRAFRVGEAGHSPSLTPVSENTAVAKPTVAVIPFSARNEEREYFAIGELIADGVIAQLGRSVELKVISRLATTALRDRLISVQQVESQLKADYAISGSYVANNASLLVTAELVNTHSQEVLWVERLSGSVSDLLQPASDICHVIAATCHNAILGLAVQHATYQPLPTLAGHSLLFAGIAGVHQSAGGSFRFSGKALSTVIERHPKYAEAYAWLAKWHAIGANRGISGVGNQTIATDLADRALQASPDSAFALTISGLMRAFFKHDLSGAEAQYAHALALNPNEPLAWLYTATLRAWQGRGTEAGVAAQRALDLTPIGSAQYYVESLAGIAFVCAGLIDKAIPLLQHSLRVNSTHTSSHRALAIALVMRGSHEEARKIIKNMLMLEPNYTTAEFMRRYPGRDHPHAKVHEQALMDAGIPRG